jgi:non-lysosomal glucosylceramidase
MLAEALTVIEATRCRHDGERRNPWNEPECGHHYARAMSSWAVIVALNGFHYSGTDRRLALTPRVKGGSLRSFWTAPSGWGTFWHTSAAASQHVEVQAVEGNLDVASLVLAGNTKPHITARLGTDPLPVSARQEGKRKILVFGQEARIVPERPLTVRLRA